MARVGESPTLVTRALAHPAVVGIASRLPVPLAVARPFLLHDNRSENRAGSWDRLRHPSESARYAAVAAMAEQHAPAGFVLDVGCSQGLLAERLRYSRYVGLDSYAPAIARAAVRADSRTSFRYGDADAYQPDAAPDVVVLNEVLYYLPHPLATVQRYARLLAPGGVLVISMYLHTWATRRLLRRISALVPLCDTVTVQRSSPLAWVVSVHRPGG